jgi:hypothetical protein
MTGQPSVRRPKALIGKQREHLVDRQVDDLTPFDRKPFVGVVMEHLHGAIFELDLDVLADAASGLEGQLLAGPFPW